MARVSAAWHCPVLLSPPTLWQFACASGSFVLTHPHRVGRWWLVVVLLLWRIGIEYGVLEHQGEGTGTGTAQCNHVGFDDVVIDASFLARQQVSCFHEDTKVIGIQLNHYVSLHVWGCAGAVGRAGGRFPHRHNVFQVVRSERWLFVFRWLLCEIVPAVTVAGNRLADFPLTPCDLDIEQLDRAVGAFLGTVELDLN